MQGPKTLQEIQAQPVPEGYTPGWLPRPGNWVPGVNVRNIGRQLGSYVGLAPKQDYDIFDNFTISNRPGQTQLLPGGGNRSTPVDNEPAPGVPHLDDYTAPWRVAQREQQAAAQAEAQRQAAIQAQANPLLQALSGLDTTLSNNLKGVRDTYDQQMREYNDRFARDRANWEENVATNEGGLQSQRQNKMLSGARLSQGLNSILASMGALNGTGQFLANQAVEGITNRGLGEATETFQANARNINSAWEEAEQEARNREERAKQIRADQEANVRADILGKRQQILSQLGQLYGPDTAEGARYLGQAGSLYGQIAQTTRPNVAQYQEASSLYSPSALESYLSGIGNTQVTSESRGSGGGVPVNSPLFAGTRRRRDEQLV